jgi:curved DNA-binding protein CbpA
MHVSDALVFLGLKWPDMSNKALINSAWRKKIKIDHPDKNLESADATVLAQRVNEARDTLFNFHEDRTKKKQREDEEERVARAKDEETKRQQRQQQHAQQEEAWRQQQQKEEAEKEEARHQKEEADREEAKRQQHQREQEKDEIRRERFIRNRKKRAAGTRAHKKMDDYKEGREFIEEMQTFFKDKFYAAPDFLTGALVYFEDIVQLFTTTREKQTTEVEKNWFRLHTKRIFLHIFPSATCSNHKNRRCFKNIVVK